MKPKVPYLELIHGYFGNIISVFQKHNVRYLACLYSMVVEILSNLRRTNGDKVKKNAEEELQKVYIEMRKKFPPLTSGSLKRIPSRRTNIFSRS